MVHQEFVQLLRQLQSLTNEQRTQVRHALGEAPLKPLNSIAPVLSAPNACPHCGAPAQQLRSRGFSHGLVRLRKREQWTRYAQALIEGVSVREAAGRCGIDKNSAFLWHHRFLKATSTHRAKHAGGIVEADETFFLESFKGQRKLHRPARKRGGVGAQWEQIAMLQPLVDKDAILCTDGAAVYKAFAKATGIMHRPVNIQQGSR